MSVGVCYRAKVSVETVNEKYSREMFLWRFSANVFMALFMHNLFLLHQQLAKLAIVLVARIRLL